VDVSVLLGCDAAALNIWFLTFRDSVVVSSFRGLSFPTFRNNAVVSSVKEFRFHLKLLEDETTALFRKVGNRIPSDAAS
jgi:hypothetical protein